MPDLVGSDFDARTAPKLFLDRFANDACRNETVTEFFLRCGPRNGKKIMNTKMCWPRLRFFAGLLSLTLGFFFVIASTTDTAIAKRPPAWQLVDWAQEACVSIGNPGSDRTTYYGIYIKGRWNHSINAGLRNAPPGSTQWGSYLPIPPGSSNGEYSLAYVALQLAPDTDIGFYTVNLWAGDGTTLQSVPVTLEVAEDCGY